VLQDPHFDGHDHQERASISKTSTMLPSVLAITLLLSGCYYTSSINTDAAQRTNAALEKYEQGIGASSSYSSEPQIRLWSDKPQYAGLPDAKHLKEMHLISAVPPEYPYWLHVARVEANVLVCFVVGTDGRVEDARVIESSDARFDSSAHDAIQKFTWIPAQGAGGPEREMAVIPFYFRAPKKGS
jgi:TonB family protein